jgi:hypothetical protein
VWKLLPAVPDLQPASERRREVRHYGTGWFWQQYDHNHAALVPLSTAYLCHTTPWRHVETCAVDRIQGTGCTCRTADERMNDGEKEQAENL